MTPEQKGIAIAGILVLTIPAVALSLELRTESEKACRDWVEWNIETPSTISSYRDEAMDREAGTIYLAGSAKQCSAVGWPDEVCDVLTAQAGTLGENGEQNAVDIWENTEEIRRADELVRLEAYSTLSEEQRAATHIDISFDAENTYGAPIRYEAFCTVKESPKTGKPVILEANFTRGF